MFRVVIPDYWPWEHPLDFRRNLKWTCMQDLKPRNIGPGGMSGRVTAIDAVTFENPDVMYVGTASGGLVEIDFRRHQMGTHF